MSAPRIPLNECRLSVAVGLLKVAVQAFELVRDLGFTELDLVHHQSADWLADFERRAAETEGQ